MHAFERVDRLSLRIPDYIAIVMWNHVPYGMVQIIEAALITGTIMENGMLKQKHPSGCSF